MLIDNKRKIYMVSMRRALAVMACFVMDSTTSLNLLQRRPRRIAIVGGGPGGLTLANALLETSTPDKPSPYEEARLKSPECLLEMF